jgi:hypothetical protein
MKKVLLMAVMAFSLLSVNAQEPISFEKVITVDSVKKEVIYSTILQWIGSNYHDIKNDSQLSDKDAGFIMKDAAIPFVKTGFMQCYGGFINFKMKFQIKDGRFKVELNSFSHRIIRNDCAFKSCMGIITTAIENPIGGGMNKSTNDKIWNEIKQLCEKKANDLFSEFEKLKFKSDNW